MKKCMLWILDICEKPLRGSAPVCKETGLIIASACITGASHASR